MDDTNSEKRFRTKLQEQAAEWLQRGEHNAMVTLTFTGDGVSHAGAQKLFGVFAHKLKCHLFGKKSKKRIAMCPIVEDFGAEMMWRTSPRGVRQGTHIHCLMRLPGSPLAYKEVVRQLWRASGRKCGDPKVNCPNRDYWLAEMIEEHDKTELTNYVLKKCAANIDGVLVKFMPIRPAT